MLPMQGLSLMVAIFTVANRPASPATIVRTDPSLKNKVLPSLSRRFGYIPRMRYTQQVSPCWHFNAYFFLIWR